MKAVIIVFNPSGHTVTAAQMIQKSIEDKGGTADILNITKDDSLLFASKSERQKILEKRLQEFDILFAGAPVYVSDTISITCSALPPCAARCFLNASRVCLPLPATAKTTGLSVRSRSIKTVTYRCPLRDLVSSRLNAFRLPGSKRFMAACSKSRVKLLPWRAHGTRTYL